MTNNDIKKTNFISQLILQIDKLQSSQLVVLLQIADALENPVDVMASPNSDIATAPFLEDFTNRIRIYHATHTYKLDKKAFEYAFIQASIASGRQASITINPVFPGQDITVDGVGYSLKTTAEAGLKQSVIKISKFMEARWIRGSTPDQFIYNINSVLVPHIEKYARIILLRAFDVKDIGVQYDLLEIPTELLLEMRNLTTDNLLPVKSNKSNGSMIAEVQYRGQNAYRVRFDGSVEKVTIENLLIDLCHRHASWRITLRSCLY